MIHLANGVSFRWKIASGALGYDGYGWLWDYPYRWFGLLKPELFLGTTKSLTRHPRMGNLRWHSMFGFGCVQKIKEGWANAVGLTNPGINWWCREIGPKVSLKQLKLIVSIVGDTEELAEMADMLNNFDIAAIEVNVSCPNSGEMPTADQIVEGVHAVRQRSKHPVLFKASPAQERLVDLVKDLRGLASSVELNSVPWKRLFGEKKNPLKRFGGGGVSGKAARSITWQLLQALVHERHLPVIGSNVCTYRDLEYLFQGIGVDAISFGVIHMPHVWDPRTWFNPTKPTRYVERYEKEEIGFSPSV